MTPENTGPTKDQRQILVARAAQFATTVCAVVANGNETYMRSLATKLPDPGVAVTWKEWQEYHRDLLHALTSILEGL